MPEINSKFLERAYSDLLAMNKAREENSRYVEGDNPWIMDKKAEKAPDNRIPIPFAKMAVEDMAGYAGRPGDMQIEFERMEDAEDEQEEDQEDAYQAFVDTVRDYNSDDVNLAELYQEALTQGVSYELWWVNPEEMSNGIMMPEFAMLPSSECFPIWSPKLKPELESFIRFYKIGKDLYADVYEKKAKKSWRKTEDSDDFLPYVEGDTEYPYDRVPINWYPINRGKTSLFQAEKGIIDAHDNIIAKSLNEVDRFNALIALFPGEVSKEFADKLKEMGLIDKLDNFERWPEYLQKDYSGVTEFYKDMLDRLERLYHKSIKIPDMTNASFAGNDESGVARAFKLLGMEFKAAQIESYFRQGLYRRFDMINDVIKISSASFKDDLEDYTITVNWKRNLPVDEAAAVSIATSLVGIVSEETLLKILPARIVEDAKKEMERKANEVGGILDEPEITDDDQ